MKVLKFAAAVFAVALVAYFGMSLFLGSVVKAGVNRFAPRMTKTRVELAGARISPITGSGVLTGLFVGNPPGWSSDKAFSFGRIHVAVAPFSIFGDHIIVKEIVVDQPEFVYETKLVSSNIGELLKNISEASGGDPSAKATTKSGKPIKFEVKHFLLKDGHVTLGVGSEAMTLPMPPVELTDLGTGEGGITSDQLALAVMRSVTNGVVSATTKAVGKIGSTMGAAAGGAAQRTGEDLKNLFEGKK
jgi:hypothetical protein